MSTSPWDAVCQRYGCERVDEAGSDVVASGSARDLGAACREAWLTAPPSFDEVLHGPVDPDSDVAPIVSMLDEVFNDASARQAQREAPKERARARRRRVWRALATVLGCALVLSLVGGGGYLVYRGLGDSQVEDLMPLPSQTYQDAEVSQDPVELTSDVLTREWPVVNADSDQGSDTWDINTEQYRIDTMSIERMAPGSVFIPEAGIYAEVRASDHFESSKYNGFQTLDIPTNVHRGVWYSSGAPLTGTDLAVLTGERPTAAPTPSVAPEAPQSSASSAPTSTPSSPSPIVPAPTVDQNAQGTTLIASHVSWTRRHRGAFYTMSTDVVQGELIWVKGFDGSLSTWRVNGMWFAEHEAFPQEYFSATGPRQLVLTTCGGRVNSHGYYQQNVFTVAVPVPLEDAVDSAD